MKLLLIHIVCFYCFWDQRYLIFIAAICHVPIVMWVAENCYSSCNLFDLIIFLLKWWYCILSCVIFLIRLIAFSLSLSFVTTSFNPQLHDALLEWSSLRTLFSLFFFLFALPDINFWGSCSQFSDCIFFNEPFTWRNRWSNLSFA